MKNFWQKLKLNNKPLFAAAPMLDVTDAAFRRMIAKYSKAACQDGRKTRLVIFTEFVAVDGLCSAGKKNLLQLLKYTEKERPIVAQVFGSKPENFYKAAQIIRKLGFDGIDINMGCPQDNIVKQGAGAALIKDFELAKKIISETKRGAGKMPVSVKTRIGWDKNIIAEWMRCLLEAEPAAITIHGRTKKEMSLVPAHWDAIAEAVKVRNEYCKKSRDIIFSENYYPVILGNGDIKDMADAEEKIKMSGVDGVMVGRALFGKPWFFSKNSEIVNIETRLKIMVEHVKLYEKIFGTGEKRIKSFNLMKKHFKAYVSGFDGAADLRAKLMETKNAAEVAGIVKGFLKEV